jgi:SAM-dependent methyltransferase
LAENPYLTTPCQVSNIDLSDFHLTFSHEEKQHPSASRNGSNVSQINGAFEHIMVRLMPRLRAVKDVWGSSAQQPHLNQLLAPLLPTMIRGRRFGSEWHSNASPTPIASSTGSAAANPFEAFADFHIKGRGMWKWNHYLDIYHRHFQKFIGKEVHVVEVGVFSGGSLEMYKSYFGSKCHVYGVDIREECRSLQNETTKIFIGDQADRGFWRRFRQEVPVLDILIDDGGHKTEQQIVTLEEMLPHLRPGGVFVCEDVVGEFNGFDAYVGGLTAKLDLCELVRGPVKELSSVAAPFQADIDSIHNYSYVTVIEKRTSPIRQFEAFTRGTDWAWVPLWEKKAAAKS